MSKHLPTPYIKCGASDGKCQCAQIWSKPADTQIGNIIIGKWGDKYPAIRIKEPRGIGAVAEPYMEMIEYGEIPEEVAHATIDFILLACNMHDELVKALSLAIEALDRLPENIFDTEDDVYDPFRPEGASWPIMAELMSSLRATLVKVKEQT